MSACFNVAAIPDPDAGERPAGHDSPLIAAKHTPERLVPTDEYDSRNRKEEGGYRHKTDCPGKAEFAHDEDDDGFHEVHVNTIEGFWSLL